MRGGVNDDFMPANFEGYPVNVKGGDYTVQSVYDKPQGEDVKHASQWGSGRITGPVPVWRDTTSSYNLLRTRGPGTNTGQNVGSWIKPRKLVHQVEVHWPYKTENGTQFVTTWSRTPLKHPRVFIVWYLDRYPVTDNSGDPLYLSGAGAAITPSIAPAAPPPGLPDGTGYFTTGRNLADCDIEFREAEVTLPIFTDNGDERKVEVLGFDTLSPCDCSQETIITNPLVTEGSSTGSVSWAAELRPASKVATFAIDVEKLTGNLHFSEGAYFPTNAFIGCAIWSEFDTGDFDLSVPTAEDRCSFWFEEVNKV